MNNERDADPEVLNSALAQHLHLHLPSERTVPAVAAESDTLAGNNHTYGEGAEDTTLPGNSSFSDTSAALYNLLMRYVDLLEGQERGGWTLDEEAAVRAAVTALARSGWKLPLPHDTGVETLTTPHLASLLARERESFAAWSRSQGL